MTRTGQQLADEQQITTPKDWHPTRPVTGKQLVWVAGVLIAVIGFAIGLSWEWVFPIWR